MDELEGRVSTSAKAVVVEALARCSTRTDVQNTLRELIRSGATETVAAAADAAQMEGERPLSALACLRGIVLAANDATETGTVNAPLIAGLALLLQSTFRTMGWRSATSDNWLRDAITQLDFDARTQVAAALEKTAAALDGNRPEIRGQEKARDRAAISAVAAIVRRVIETNAVSLERRQRRAPFFLLCSLLLGAAALIWACRNWLIVPPAGMSSKGFWLFAIYLWVPALLATWLLARANAKRTHTFDYISTKHFGANEGLVAGQHESFKSDLFFHIFQFVWLPTLIYLLLVELNHPRLIEMIGHFDTTGPAVAQSFDWIHRPLLDAVGSAAAGNFEHAIVNEQVGLALGLIVGAATLFMQLRLQRSRVRSGIDVYWWDIRIGWSTWAARWIMLGIDMVMATLIIQKIFVFNAAVAILVSQQSLPLSIFASDGFGGVAALRDAVAINAFGALVLGLLVISSWYLHRDLPQYRGSDTTLATLYFATILALIVAPMWRIEHLLRDGVSVEKERLIADVLQAGGGGVSADALQATSAIGDWNPSLLELNMLTSPILVLLVQAAFFVVQTVRQRQQRYAASWPRTR